MASIGKEDSELTAARNRMVDRQLIRRGIDDPRVLDAFRRVPRHLFISPQTRDQAYADCPLPIGRGQTISQPYIVAAMVQALGVAPDARVLEIGTGSGYETAILAELVDTVHTVELIPELAEQARELLTGLGYSGIRYRVADGSRGWPEAAPFDGIVVSAAPPRTPQTLLDQLAIGAACVIPEGEGDQELNRYRRTATDWEKERLMAVRFVPLVQRPL